MAGAADWESRMNKARAARQVRFNTRLEWLGQQVHAGIKMTVRQRVIVATQLLRDQVVINISKPVRKIAGGSRGRTRVDPTSRSKPGEFPRADTTRLMKDVFSDVREEPGSGKIVGRVAITLDYGLVLETLMDRSFLVRTLNEMRGKLAKTLGMG